MRKIIFVAIIFITFIINSIKIVPTNEVTIATLENRKDSYILVEKVFGKVVDTEKNGVILNTESEYNYISYSNMEDVNTGDEIITYLVYKNTVGEDDILFRIDKKI